MFAAHYVLGKTNGMNEDDALQNAWDRSTTPAAMAGHFEAGREAVWMEAAGLFIGIPFGTMRTGARMKKAARNAYSFKAALEKTGTYGDSAAGLAS